MQYVEQDNIESYGFIDSETEFELGLIEDMDTLAKREKEDFVGNRLITKNSENDGEDNFFNEEYFDN